MHTPGDKDLHGLTHSHTASYTDRYTHKWADFQTNKNQVVRKSTDRTRTHTHKETFHDRNLHRDIAGICW